MSKVKNIQTTEGILSRILHATDNRFRTEESIADLSSKMLTSPEEPVIVIFPHDDKGHVHLSASLTGTAIQTVKAIQKVLGKLSYVARPEVGLAAGEKGEAFISGLYIPAETVPNIKEEAIRQLNSKLPKGEKLAIPENSEDVYFSAEKLNMIMQTLRNEERAKLDSKASPISR